ncbi:ImmA/IrrE family metallo-endopeptidase [Herpetosiphon gulosus]|uniref:IrrE N-terminal-like domain-containing protein n=1 Tax=Herpetosiphon gulosus TaxID=1973496 RepID=A0ABP9X9I7_9CHLR
MATRQQFIIDPHKQSPATDRFLNHIEQHAYALRQDAGISRDEHVDPYRIAEVYGVTILLPSDIPQLSEADRQYIENQDPSVWSGLGGPDPEGGMIIILNPKQTKERAAVTIMEEVAHIYYGHEPSLVMKEGSDLDRRLYLRGIEQEAYWTAAAVLLPRHMLARAIWKQRSIETIAAAYGVSTELVVFRAKVLGLWNDLKRVPQL